MALESMPESAKLSSVSFFCPARNEEKNLREAVEKAHKALTEAASKFEILIIENGSTDATPKIADDLAKEFQEVRVIHYPHGLGYGGAVREGFLHSKLEYVCYTDSDNQYDIRELMAARKYLESADIISGYVRQKAVSVRRRLQSNVFNDLVRILFFFPVRDVNCSMKIYKRKVLDAIEIKSRSAFIDAEMLIKAYKLGFTIAQFPVTHFERTHGSAIGSKPSVVWDTIVDMIKFRFGKL